MNHGVAQFINTCGEMCILVLLRFEAMAMRFDIISATLKAQLGLQPMLVHHASQSATIIKKQLWSTINHFGKDQIHQNNDLAWNYT
mmetsp:Transcript_20479/g.32470  ORF Transcript_20479/g.32470 Transcript_20479/m.32470 type:complete len:86 (-) Transcript_20479:289-546(-)